MEGPEEGHILSHASFGSPLLQSHLAVRAALLAHAALPLAEQLKEKHRICDSTSQWPFVRLLGFGMPKAFMVC